MIRSKRSLAGLVVAAALIAGACGSDGGDSTSPPATPPANESAAGPLAQVATSVSGGSVDLSQFDGTDTIAWFWAPW